MGPIKVFVGLTGLGLIVGEVRWLARRLKRLPPEATEGSSAEVRLREVRAMTSIAAIAGLVVLGVMLVLKASLTAIGFVVWITFALGFVYGALSFAMGLAKGIRER